MTFIETELPGAYVVEPDVHSDERGFFGRAFCAREFAEHGLNATIAQCNISYNAAKGTLRGMHYQEAPHGEAKLVRCFSGSVFDVLIDLRENSPSFCRWTSVVLSGENRRAVYIPEGFAHGFLTLMDRTVLYYQVSEFYTPDSGRGVRWDDPMFGITWPEEVRVISERDGSYPDFKP